MEPRWKKEREEEKVVIKIWIEKMIDHGTSNYNVPVGVTNCKVLSSWSMSMTFFSLALNFDLVRYATHFLKLQISIHKKEGKMHQWGIIKKYIRVIWECHTVRSLSFIWKYKNSRMKVDRRVRDTVLNLIVLSFNCSRPKWRLKAP